MDSVAVNSAETDLQQDATGGPGGSLYEVDGVRVRVGSAFEMVDEVWREWNGLVPHASEPNVFAERWFARASLAHLHAGADVRMLEVRDGTTLVGLLPLVESLRYDRVRVRHLRNWEHSHSFVGTPLVRAGDELLFWEAVLGALDAADWAGSFLHLSNLVEHGPVHAGLVAAVAASRRPCDVVHRSERALLQSTLAPRDYYQETVPEEERDALKLRLAELQAHGAVSLHSLDRAEELTSWCDAFLALEKSGSKGRTGSALGCSEDGEAFFRKVITAAFEQGRLDMLRLDLGDKPLAMLANLLASPGSFSFEFAVDEDFSRFSPDVLIQLENLRILARDEIAWLDSCRIGEEARIDSLWTERRPIISVAVRLSGFRRRLIYFFCRMIAFRNGQGR